MHDVAKPLVESKRKSMAKPIVFTALGLLALVLVIVGIKALQIGKMMGTKMTMPPTTVSSATVEEQDWAPMFSAVGSISPVQGAIVSTELGGVVADIRFENGGTAKKGDVLLRLDASSEEAQLHTAEADLDLARQDVAARA